MFVTFWGNSSILCCACPKQKLIEYSVLINFARCCFVPDSIITLHVITKRREKQTLLGNPNSYHNYHNSRHYPSFCILFKTQRFGDRILSPSSSGTYSVGHIRSETWTSSIYWTQLYRLHIKTETGTRLRNVQNCDRYNNISSSQTIGSFKLFRS
jgi:hypothetical protein